MGLLGGGDRLRRAEKRKELRRCGDSVWTCVLLLRTKVEPCFVEHRALGEDARFLDDVESEGTHCAWGGGAVWRIEVRMPAKANQLQ